ncbi:hypothetical protein J437_LFUL011137 [Ladona fulva]|uniref:Uncharacterized protein n=1 Tax=Ladona fulva TaxID=123851 RepID=A0A8K0K6I4_LADFU|nr:hypothetical protein J437_LFUL011137 [Ladona fulva]
MAPNLFHWLNRSLISHLYPHPTPSLFCFRQQSGDENAGRVAEAGRGCPVPWGRERNHRGGALTGDVGAAKVAMSETTVPAAVGSTPGAVTKPRFLIIFGGSLNWRPALAKKERIINSVQFDPPQESSRIDVEIPPRLKFCNSEVSVANKEPSVIKLKGLKEPINGLDISTKQSSMMLRLQILSMVPFSQNNQNYSTLDVIRADDLTIIVMGTRKTDLHWDRCEEREKWMALCTLRYSHQQKDL